MSTLNISLARDAAGLIAGLSAEEHAAVIETLRGIAVELGEPDTTLKEARATAASIQKTLAKLHQQTRRLSDGWGDSLFELPDEVVTFASYAQTVPWKEMAAAADAMVRKLDQTEVRGGHGGLLAQGRGRVKKYDAVRDIAVLWNQTTLRSFDDPDGLTFIEVGWEAVSGDGDHVGLSRLISEIARELPDNTTAAGAVVALGRLDLADSMIRPGCPRAPHRQILHDRFRRLLEDRVSQEG